MRLNSYDYFLNFDTIKKFLSILFVSISCFFFTESKCQSYTINDFKLCLDTFGCKNTIRITKKQLLAAKKVEANFNFFHIKSLTIYVGGIESSDTFTFGIVGNTFTKETKKYFEKIGTNSVITIIANGVNNSGKQMEWGELHILIVE